MHLQYEASQQYRRFSRRYPWIRRLTVATTILTLLWIYALHWGERSVFGENIGACDWKKWEEWPREAAPHHLVFIADPQLVDPHTYPGRPWPLSTLTERYTDLYMARNFRLINAHLDPDSIVFLGDLFDGGREWAPGKAKGLKTSQRKKLEHLGIIAEKEKRSMESYKAALSRPHAYPIIKEDHNIGPNGKDLREFVPGENGRWAKWGYKQWDSDFARFGRIFLDAGQLYPGSDRRLFAAYDVPQDPVNIENGADNVTWQEYATSGAQQRRLITTLPGNHDLGLGAGVQLAVRDRFQSRFGEPNRIDVLGNHTFVSLDTPSLSAHSQYLPSGYESGAGHLQQLTHIWKPPMDFLEDVRTPARKLVSHTLSEYYPSEHEVLGWPHRVRDTNHANDEPLSSGFSKDSLKTKPQLPVVLLSHVPLYRPPESDCSRLREKGNSIRIAMGYQYQNVLTQPLSKDIVTKVSAAGDIVGIFSGDDHDYCDVTHKYNIAPYTPLFAEGAPGDMKSRLTHIKEITVKSFSWAMGVRKPGFLLVSLWNPVDAQGKTIGTPLPTVQTHQCLLPDQLGIFINYGLLLVFTLPMLLIRAVLLGLRTAESPDSDDGNSTPTRMTLPRFRPKSNGTANGYAHPTLKESKGRHRASSSSASVNNSSNLGVQRSYNARTRSVSPALGISSNQPQPVGPLIEKAGYFPQVKWIDPADEESDEESHVGKIAEEDSQAKTKWRRRAPRTAKKVFVEFGASLLVVGVPSMLWYFFLIRNG